MKIVNGKVVEDEEDFKEEDAEETVFVRESEKAVDPDAALPEEIRKKSKADLQKEVEEARAAAAAASAPKPDEAVAKALGALAEKLSPQERAVVTPAAGESEEAFVARLKTDLFDENKVGTALRDAVTRYAGPLLAQQQDAAYETTLKLMRLDPDTGSTFRKYESDVMAFLRKQFPGNERNPKALEIAFSQVKAAHVEDIARDMAQKILDEERKKTPAAPAREREPQTLESGRSTPRATSGVARRTEIVITPQDEREAEVRGVSPEVMARARMRRSVGR